MLVQPPRNTLTKSPSPKPPWSFPQRAELRSCQSMAATPFSNAGNGYVGAGANASGAVTIDGATSAWHNTGGVEIGSAGIGTLTLVDGGTISAGGTLAIGTLGTLTGNGTAAGTLTNGGTVSAGLETAGTLAVTGNFSQSASGKLVVELFGTGNGQFDRLQVSGAATLNGTLQVLLGSNGGTPFVPQLGDTFSFLSASQGRTGAFSVASLPSLPAGDMWQVRYAAGAATLAVTWADDNDNGTVGAADYVIRRQLVGSLLRSAG